MDLARDFNKQIARLFLNRYDRRSLGLVGKIRRLIGGRDPDGRVRSPRPTGQDAAAGRVGLHPFLGGADAVFEALDAQRKLPVREGEPLPVIGGHPGEFDDHLGAVAGVEPWRLRLDADLEPVDGDRVLYLRLRPQPAGYKREGVPRTP